MNLLTPCPPNVGKVIPPWSRPVLWSSEVGRRSLGIKTFWFEAVYQNHIVWDAVEVVDFSRKHTANVHDGLSEIRQIVERLTASRDARRDGFVAVIRKAIQTTRPRSSRPSTAATTWPPSRRS